MGLAVFHKHFLDAVFVPSFYKGLVCCGFVLQGLGILCRRFTRAWYVVASFYKGLVSCCFVLQGLTEVVSVKVQVKLFVVFVSRAWYAS
jgi:hypothetical protein